MGVTFGKQEAQQCMGFNGINENSADMEFDLIVIGGGSGGIAAAKQAAKFGKRVALIDFVRPSPAGTTWGLGGTCVNVGCIPKKLMHQAALLGKCLDDAPYFGWSTNRSEEGNHNWEQMIENIQRHIHGINWGHKSALNKLHVTYFNAFAQFLDEHAILLTDKKGEAWTVTGNYFIIAVGGRPKFLDIPGGHPYEYCITSDDLFSLPYLPGKTLVVGGSYVALECAGFLAALGYDTTIMARSVLLRGFDQQMAQLVGKVLQEHGVRILQQCIPIEIKRIEEGEPPVHLVTSKNLETEEIVEEMYNTILLAVGRSSCTEDLALENAGVRVNPINGKIPVDESERTNVKNIFTIGDVRDGGMELTPVAIEAGVLLANRLFSDAKELTNYDKIPTTVFTPLEYGCVGLSEEEAISRHGAANIEVYHVTKQPLEFTLSGRDKGLCYSKIICLKTDKERVLGFHYLGPNAGEITQGYALAVKMNATKEDFDSVIGIHPTCSEIHTTMYISKSSGKSHNKTNC